MVNQMNINNGRISLKNIQKKSSFMNRINEVTDREEIPFELAHPVPIYNYRNRPEICYFQNTNQL